MDEIIDNFINGNTTDACELMNDMIEIIGFDRVLRELSEELELVSDNWEQHHKIYVDMLSVYSLKYLS